MAINKQKVHYTNVHFNQPAGLHRWHGTWNSGRKNTLVGPLQHTSHFSLPNRVITQDMVGANSLQRLIVSIVYGIKAHLSHMALILFEPNIGCQKCNISDLVLSCPRYAGGLPAT